MKRKMIYHPDKQLFEIDGVFYGEKKVTFKKIDGIEHMDKIIYEELDLEKDQENIDFLKEELADKIPHDRVIEEIIKSIPSNKLKRMVKLIKEKTNCKIVVGQNGLVWISGDNIEGELKAKEAIEFVVGKSFIDGLTEKVEGWFEKK